VDDYLPAFGAVAGGDAIKAMTPAAVRNDDVFARPIEENLRYRRRRRAQKRACNEPNKSV
jgi:hypothetical protein